ncbi:MAG TPA: HAD hydrolase family protein [Bryobacteraceae bacterium]|nr:HAD hydrolase family protein [Bryobacteraceae bacterium]
MDIQTLASKVKLLLMDVDGVLTDGRIFNLPNPDGSLFETKGFDSQDGIALQWLKRYGIECGVISGRDSQATEARARQIGMKYVYQGHIEKIPILEEIFAKSGLRREEVGYIGDDLTDIVIMRRVGFTAAPANARPEVKAVAHFVASAAGGGGAVREVAEVILKAQGFWEKILKHYEAGA